ncbi:TetR/AcrR family transcriptional regulator C-terminal domain-containing protein [Dactylosporangium sp. AC04546]|uniref:TetR/AcrR family transcriptional regulator n=1 Tax=Dactylosporangium sp. AC04546 TaxID=2862460 RepID=UPI001EE11C22|nr:TetR/AcrR family transcriptional regulator C-terminal domain-containing protein [Dactylosporangium sp. AC04546]WVK89258.1 TetR/AcrR family transcriptional regulator C-terminal domain-containing protein [Dactylosporangium sp. AC04546]
MRTGGRAATFGLEDVVRAGVAIGLVDLTVQGVADALGVTPAAVYRHVPTRSALERLVGEAVLDGLVLVDHPEDAVVAHLVDFACQLREFILRHPGSAQYFMRLFPNGPSGVRLMEHQMAALGRRGFEPSAAMVLSSGIATLAIGAAFAEQERAVAHLDTQATEAAWAAVAGSEVIRTAAAEIPPHTPEDYFVLILTAAAEGLVAQVPAGRPFTLPAPGEDR